LVKGRVEVKRVLYVCGFPYWIRTHPKIFERNSFLLPEQRDGLFSLRVVGQAVYVIIS